MKVSRIRPYLAAAVFLAALAPALSAEAYPSFARFSVLKEKAIALAAQYGAENVLIAFDCDNTLLTMADDFGSEAWFDWQDGLIREGAPGRMASNFDELLVLQGMLFYLVGTRPAADDLAGVLKDLQDAGFPMIVLTGRGPEYRFVTERELNRSLPGFERKGIPDAEAYAQPFLPFDYNNVDASGFLVKEDLWRFNLKPPAPVSFRNGILLTSGQHKGVMLRTLLYLSGTAPAAILYVDNKERQLNAVASAFEGLDVEVAGLRFSGADKLAEPFAADKDSEEKRSILRRWAELQAAFGRAFPPVEDPIKKNP